MFVKFIGAAWLLLKFMNALINLVWKGFGVSSYTPDRFQLLNYLASGTFREVFELNEVCLREVLCLLTSLAWLKFMNA